MRLCDSLPTKGSRQAETAKIEQLEEARSVGDLCGNLGKSWVQWQCGPRHQGFRPRGGNGRDKDQEVQGRASR